MKQVRVLAVYAALFFSICMALLFRNRTEIHAEELETCSVSYIHSVSEMENLSPGYTKYTVASGKGKNSTMSYFKFTLDKDSWVCLTGHYSMYVHDGAGSHVEIFYDSAMEREAGSFGWGYWQYDKEFTGFLKKGTYYVSVATSKENYRGDFTGNVNVTLAAVRVSTLFDFKEELGKKQDHAKISIPDALGNWTKSVQYRKGSVGLANVDDSRYWKKRTTSSPNDAYILEPDNGRFSFRASKNSPYTVMVEDVSGSRYSSVINISSIDQTKPSITGVKNGKVYKRAVTVKFFDAQSGVRSAMLNGRKIRSGSKIKTPGAYRVEVVDRAGNRATVKFCIKG